MKMILRIFWLILGIGLSLVVLLIFASPYKKHLDFEQEVLIRKIEINASAEQVYNYLGNSAMASEWSSFVDHIALLNPETHQDGMVGSTRRCFERADSTGMIWDEEILIAEPFKRRRLSIYNLQGYPLSCPPLLTEQLYQSIDPQRVQVALTLFLDETRSNWWDKLKLYYVAYKIAAIFEENLKNIKRLNENTHG